eukprot:13901911-Heterocapsa_arctica.AAC.1
MAAGRTQSVAETPGGRKASGDGGGAPRTCARVLCRAVPAPGRAPCSSRAPCSRAGLCTCAHCSLVPFFLLWYSLGELRAPAAPGSVP